MDLETENRIASILLREAAELRRQAEKDGVRAYLEKPNVRHRPNSRFLTATVLSVQQANKALETNEMWSLRSKEIECDERLKSKSRQESSSGQSEHSNRKGFVKRCTSLDENVTTHLSSSPSSSQNRNKRWQSEDDDDYQGLRDVDVKTFLQSRVKRGRGSVGPKMDETFPCLPVTELSRTSGTGDRKLVRQPERSPLLRRRTDSSSSSEEEVRERAHRKRKEHKKKLSKKHKSKEKQRNRKKRKYGSD
ncbi:PREDICTED: G patch domain-containing protein 1 [Camelina sativa]|uniref:G patch domain-containing protein 1 n=1 Tax=Camelina sativa TaxID=90675 RepID=A0ABM0UW35_CAMSA|nr:PREDICTED: G patch domain-containing protein 1 [Camelina sativa]